MANAEKLITENLDLWASTTKARLGTGRGSNKKTELYGVRKLRELILDLGLQGLLVPQIEDDNASTKAITTAHLEQKATINKSHLNKNLAKQSTDSAAKIPINWQWVPLGELVDVLDKYRKPITKSNRTSGPIPYYGATGVVDHINDFIFDEKLVLVGEDGAKWSKGDPTAFIINGKTWVNNHAHVIRPIRSRITDEFITIALTQQDLNQFITGTTVPKLNQAKLISIPIPLPPLAEQELIVSKADELMALCDQLEQAQENNLETHETLAGTLLNALTSAAAADGSQFADAWQRIQDNFDILFTTESSVDQLKQTILKLAVMGKLVKQDSEDKSAMDSLLQNGVDLKKWNIEKENARHEIPELWTWIAFSGIGEQRLGKMLDKSKNKGTNKLYLRNTNVQWNRFELEDLKEMRIEEKEEDELRLKQGDLLICEGGEPGRCAIWREEMPEMYFQKALHRVRPCKAVLTEYLALNLEVDCANGILESFFTGATIKHLTGRSLGSYPVPIPPLNEQHRIITKVSELVALCDQLKASLSSAQETQLDLADSLVEQATQSPA